ncbi:hypothetical protein ES319_D13G186100v1 [Gossypium barbadense]|uniref:S5 DRBM domain-containing protein n=1 Tax=Gossypium barbadense TaxID=3634 RepID=A0A5J5NNR1_GOSBA|nr:hypothetical protein ES319_D13G186100v1 [Gossypium barbadense]
MSTKSQPSSWFRLLNQTFQNPPRTPPSFSRKISSPNTHYSSAPCLRNRIPKTLLKPHSPFCRKISTFSYFPNHQTPKSPLSFMRCHFSTSFTSDEAIDNLLEELVAEVELEKQKEREDRKRKGLDTKDIDEEDNEDYMGVTPLIAKLEKKELTEQDIDLMLEVPTDSDTEEDSEDENDRDDNKWELQFEKKKKMHEQLLKNFCEAGTLDDAFKWMEKVNKFEEKHFKLPLEYRVIGDLMNLLKVAEGKEKFILQQKLNRAMRLLQWKEAYDPNNPANYGVIQQQQVDPSGDHEEGAELENENEKKIVGNDDEEDEEEFDDMKERDNILLEKLNAIDKKLEEKLAELDYTFGRKGKLLEEEIRDLAEERNALTEKKRTPLYRKGFDVRLIDVNRTCKVTKGGQVVKYTALMACGNFHGVVGYAKAKAPAVPIALQKVHEKCFENLHYIERHEEHTIAHAIQTTYKKTKVYLWPAKTTTGMKAGRTVENILELAGFKNVKSKVIGSRNPHNTVKAVFKALNAVETPKDIQEKFGRTVVEKHLLQ